MAQTIEEADKLYEEEKFYEAFEMYQKISTRNISSCVIQYKIGLCYFNSPFKQKEAIHYFNSVIKNSCNDIPSEKYYYLASLLHLDEKYIEAINTYNLYLEETENQIRDFNDIKLRIKQCENGIKMKADMSQKMTTAIMDIPINTSYDEYAPIISKLDNFIVFSSKRQRDSFNYVYGDKYTFLPKNLQSTDNDIYLSYRKGIQFSHPYPQFEDKYRQAYPLFIQDGNYMLLYIELFSDQEGKGNIYETRVKKGRWLKPKKLNNKINSSFDEKGAFIANNGSTIYFSSNRPNGFGGFDIYKAIRVGKDDWSKPINLGPTINSENDEVFPFVHNDNKTLYYATNGVLSIGGFDIVSSIKEGATWSTPFNLGKEINTPYNEYQFSQIPSKRYSYFASDRQNKQSVGGFDIYNVFKPVHKMKRAIVTGTIQVKKDGNKLPLQLKVKDSNNITYRKYVYDPSIESDKFFMILFPGKNYSITIASEDIDLYTINIDLPKDTYRYQLDKSFTINDITVLNKVVGFDVQPQSTQFEITTFDEIDNQTKEESTDARYDALLMLMEMIVDRTDKDGLASLNALDDPFLDTSLSNVNNNDPDPYYTPLLDLIEKAFNEGNSNLLTTLDSVRGDSGDKIVKLPNNTANPKSILEQRYYFADDDFDITSENKKTLKEIAEFLKSRDDIELHVNWFSKKGSDEIKNQDTITQMRMNSILNYLSVSGVSQWKIKKKELLYKTSADEACILLSVSIK
ncbi:PD40 domain-containing protein [Flammeovirga kamogawensis]|uniref:PD40 domain-containing protein n=1 Tax=Flammeovirga kamogawensis TaxID=373891 RepID=A0ABX8GV74_9BACT|nr:PD40 domain-containing protein [Flammeovirga kamogawensis]MBB6461653.1 outer membrane protein OmpA-like peptidoglycan-associated protein/tetratricopeptide (TPR) repeat protein [Flammeovirga kamogawensis]QWG07421.1 PD40 domain-containing protein [Flammeovirga kamogawensis]TRX69232.1 hypothetical protein EO216_14255 [Flammeovirga kamogawensis]